MLNLIYCKENVKDKSKVCIDSRPFFSEVKQADWFQEPVIQSLLKNIDGTTVVDGFVLQNGNGEIIPPEYLPTGVKTAILVYKFPNMIFNGTQMGYNAFCFVRDLCKVQDRTLLTYRYIPTYLLEGLELRKDNVPFELKDYDNLVDDWLNEGYNDK